MAPRQDSADASSHAETMPLEVRDSAVHGKGVFATRTIARGSTIGRFTGRRYTARQQRGRDWDHGVTYLFALSDGSVIDGAEGGNATRFLNHSCAPNCVAHEVQDASGRPTIEFQALRRIPAGAELFLDYCLQVGDADPADYPCRCGAPSCRGTLVGTE